MTGSKYWGEEKYPDAVYSVYLKKVRYVSPQVNEGNVESLRVNQTDQVRSHSSIDDFDHLQWETIRERVIKAGTIQRLVESLVDYEGQLDSRQFNIFFATYRAFAQTEEVLQLIMEWYGSLFSEDFVKPSCSKSQTDRIEAVRSTIKSILVCWLDMYPEDFYEYNTTPLTEFQQPKFEFPLLDRLVTFSKAKSLHDLKHKARKLREYFRKVCSNGGLMARIGSIGAVSFEMTGYDPNVFPFIVSPAAAASNYSQDALVDNDERYAKMLADAQARAQLFDVGRENVQQIAEQLTFWDAFLFTEMKPYQCQGSIWGKRNKLSVEAVYSVRATIDQFNALCQRVMTSIVLPECMPEFRAQIIEKWIYVAKELRLLNNFSSLKAVLSSLQSQPVFRLKSTWSLVSKTSMAQFEELAAFFDHSSDNSNVETGTKTVKKTANCRRTKSDINLAVETQGTVPYLGTFLTELTMADQAYPDLTEDGLINFEKRRQEFEILAKLRLYQSAARAYKIPMDKAFCVWFNFLPALDEKECFIRSAEIEPTTVNDQSTPDSRRRLREQMPKINSLSKLFSGLSNSASSSTKELAYSQGNSSFVAPCEQSPLARDGDKRGSLETNCSGGGGCNNNNHSSSSTPQSAEKPPRGQRSRSQGAKKENRCKPQNGLKGLSRSPFGVSPSRRKNGSEEEENSPRGFTIGKYNLGSEFNPHQQFDDESPINSRLISKKRMNSSSGGGGANDSFYNREVDFITDGCRRNSSSGRHADDIAALESVQNWTHSSNDWPSSDPNPLPLFASSSASSSFGYHLPFGQPNKNYQRGGDKGRADISREMLERIKHIQQATSSSSSTRSSFGNSKYKHSSADGFGTASPSSISVSNCPREEKNFHVIRVGLDNSLQQDHQTATNTNYKSIKVMNGDRMPQLVQRALEKHLIDPAESPNYSLVQLLPDGGELRFPDQCNPFYAVAPDPTSPMLNCILRKRADSVPKTSAATREQPHSTADAKKMNQEIRNNLNRWNN